ncbi:MAG: serine/threonine-protein kinase, partial [Planctomycetota bacterium]
MSQLVDQYREQYQSGDSLAEFLRDHSSSSAEEKVAILLADQFLGWQAGTPRAVSAYSEWIAEYALPPSIWLSLVTEEFGYREDHGRELDLQRFLEDCSQLPAEAKEFAHQLAQEHEKSVPAPEAQAAAPLLDRTGESRTAPKKVGRYEIQRQLGKGQFGQVYLANDPELDRQVAIKLPSTDAVMRAGGDESVVREARMVAALAHPGIVPVFDVGRTTLGELYIVSQYIPGGDLSHRHSTQPMLQHAAAALVAKIARALHAAHNCGLVHRDVKPANIVIDENGEPKLVDFGLAIRDEERQSTDLAGSPAYMSPEQARGEGHRVDARSDIYSLGAILYELLSGTRAHPGETVESVLQSVKIGEVRPPRQRNDKIHRELDRICRCALAARTFDRYSTALDLAEDLEAFLEQVPLSPEKKLQDGALSSQVDLPQDAAEVQQITATVQSSRTTDTIQSQPVVPKGLRAFDASDADFFLQLLPGARDRNGLPATVRQWKQRLEEPPADGEQLNIGLLYGPSGCGKSSLVRAGILPQLDSRIVAVTVNAKSHGTADSILSALKTRIPELNADSLRHAVSELRKDSAYPPVVLVIDQFEQWLQHWQGEPDNELIQALRQCDGKQVRVLLLLRDDFWLAVTRLMRELDVQIVEGANATSIDAFSEHHARKVLTACGQAYGVVAPEPSEENLQFIRQAVSELSDQGKVFPVYLALFLQMMQAKSWRPQTLQELGGIEGVGVKFLQETFGKLAPARYRVHAEAAQRVLGALVPADSLIRGKPKSASELCQAADFVGREEDFQEVLSFLDRELRLLTVVEAPARAADAYEKHYQLTHDYLVPCIAQWLDQLRKNSWRGRSELELEQRADMWQRRPEWRSLPGFLAFLSILLTTQRRRWSDGQRQMMRVAIRTYSTLAVVLLLITASSLWIGRELYGRTQAARIHSQLLVAELKEIPELSPQAETWQTWVNPLVLKSLSSAELTPRAHRNLAFVSLGMTLGNLDSSLSTTVKAALASPTNELSIFSSRFRSLDNRVRDQLTAKLAEHLSDSTPSVRLRAASILMELNTSEAIDVCREHHEHLASDLISTPQNLTSFISRFSPIFSELQIRFRLAWNSPDPRARELAALALVPSFEGSPEELLVLIESADDAQFRAIKKLLLANEVELLPLLQKSLTRIRYPEWPTEHADTPAIAPEVLVDLENASGWADPNYALCQWLPLEQVPVVVEELKQHGYRLIRLRPFETDDGFRASAVWLRDGKKWDWRIGLTAEELKVAIDQQQDLLPQDVAGYLSAVSLDPNVP